MTRREQTALGALAFVLAVTAVWWALALWPLPADAPLWLVRTRAVCFGALRDTLPNGAGWSVLIGEPAAMLAALYVVWREEVAGGLRALERTLAGRIALGGVLALVVLALGLATARVASASAARRTLTPDPRPLTLDTYPRLDRSAPPLGLVDQAGDTVTLARFAGRPVIVTFAYAHCQTVCPIVVHEALDAQRRLAALGPELVVVTLDPWRDTPARLPTIAQGWGLGAHTHVLSGDTAAVQRVLRDWNAGAVRDPATGEVAHPNLAYLVDAAGRLAFAARGRAEDLVTLAGRL